MKVLVTGIAGFIGFHTALRLAKSGCQIIGIDNINNYYNTDLKYARLAKLGFNKTSIEKSHTQLNSSLYNNLKFVKLDIIFKEKLMNLFKNEKFDKVCHLAAQAGVRYSLKFPEKYIESNVYGFLNILECCKNYKVQHIVFASSSSVYGNNSNFPFSENDNVDYPISIYAATKKSNELMAYTYNHLYNINTTGLRFFTVYGPWGRPDMAYFLFADAIKNNKPIKVYNEGNMYRDFTFIDDVVDVVVRIILCDISELKSKSNVYNVGNNKPEKLNDFISVIEDNMGKKAIREFLPIQPGDVEKTYANIDKLIKDFEYNPKTNIDIGIKNFIKWFKNYN